MPREKLVSKTVRDMPEKLWAAARAKARKDGLTMRGLMVFLLALYVDGRISLTKD